MSLGDTAKAYYYMTKPGIIRGNVMVATAGFLFASKGNINWQALIAVIIGIAAVIGSACVFNNYIDRGIDSKMDRTKKRALVQGTIPVPHALLFATILGIFGSVVLILGANVLTFLVGLVGFIDYVILYGIGKRKSIHGTIIGSISGATPPVAGYVAVTNQLDAAAWLLFLILVFWQMPHFYAIGIYRLNDYKAAGLPVLPAVRGMKVTKQHMIAYMVAFLAVVVALWGFGYAGYTYAVGMIAVAGYWLWLGIDGREAADDVRWAKKIFGFSLLVLLAFSLLIAVNSWLP